MTLDYESKSLPASGSAAKAYIWPLIVLNAAVFVAVVILLLPLTIHIFGCRSGAKWCHLQALFLGVPAAVVVFITFAMPASMASAKDALWHRGNLLAICLPTLGSVAVLALLVIAVIVNS